MTDDGSRLRWKVVGRYEGLALTVAGVVVNATTWKPPVMGGWAKKLGATRV